MKILGRFNQMAAEDSTPPRERADFREETWPFFLHTIQTLLIFMKDFSLEIKEIHYEYFRKDINELAKAYQTEAKAKKLQLFFDDQKGKISEFIQRQCKYILDKENELRDIIDLLTKALTSLNTDNRDFYTKVRDHSNQIEEITRLDDIKKIKNALQKEVDDLRTELSAKERKENKQIEHLSEQVSHLKMELEETKNQSQKDGLTGIYNRKAYDEYIEELVTRNQILKKPLSMLLLDIDDFKSINDDFGHLIGDRVLMAFANKCKKIIREEDYLARYGGEEFVILLPGASLRNATKKAKQICKSIANTHYSTDDASSGSSLSITVSIGVSSLKKDDTSQDLMNRADKALYNAKRNGKNRVVSEKQI